MAGDALLHFDPRADNYRIGPGSRARVLDWSRACTGAPWVDPVTFLCSAAADGHDPQLLFAGHPTAAHAPAGAVNALLAALAGYWAEVAQQPGGAGSLRRYQARSAVGACRWLRDRTGG